METRENSWIFDIIWQLNLPGTQVKQYAYRTAHLRHSLVDFPRNAQLERLLADKAGKRADNHTVYQIILGDGTEFAIQCHDGEMRLGLGVCVSTCQ